MNDSLISEAKTFGSPSVHSADIALDSSFIDANAQMPEGIKDTLKSLAKKMLAGDTRTIASFNRRIGRSNTYTDLFSSFEKAVVTTNPRNPNYGMVDQFFRSVNQSLKGAGFTGFYKKGKTAILL